MSGNKATQPKGKLKVIIVLSIVILIVAVTAYKLWSDIRTARNETSSRITSKVQRGNIELLVTATGTLQPKDYVDVGAQVSGQIEKIHVEVGSVVKAGDLLAEIDPTIFAAQVDASRAQLRYQKAQLKDREAQLALAEVQLKRQTNLFAEDATTLETLQNAEQSYKSSAAQLEMLKAQIEQTESSLRADEAELNYAMIYAPMDGTVVSISARQGQTINASQSAPIILQIADLSVMTVQTQVSEADILKLKTGIKAYFTTLGSQGRRWYGELYRIEPTPVAENNVVLYNALFNVENKDRELLPQMTAQVFFVTASATDALYVPASALQNVKSVASANSALNDNTKQKRRRPEGSTVEPVKERTDKKQNSDNNTEQKKDRRAESAQSQAHTATAEVQVLNADGTIETRAVKVGVTNRIQAQIIEGLSEDETIVIPTGSSSTAQRPASGPQGPMPRLN